MQSNKKQRETVHNQKEQHNRRVLTTIMVIVAIIAIALTGYYIYQLLQNKQAAAPVYTLQDGNHVGNPDAPVKVEVFSSFGCSHCKSFSENQEPDFVKNYVDTGKVYFTFSPYTWETDATLDVAEASLCAAEQNAFWQYARSIFKDGLPTTVTNQIQLAKSIGLNTTKFQQCLSSDAALKTLEDIRTQGNALGVTGTPTFSVNGELFYSDKLIEAVEAALAK